jgi:CheY-like chemotaxis protein
VEVDFIFRRIRGAWMCRDPVAILCFQLPSIDSSRRYACRTRKEGSVVSGQRVVVVDGLAETEEVLKAVLEPRGLRVERIRAHATQTSDCDSSAPNVLVLHSDDAVQTKRRSWDGIPCVVIGSAEISDSNRLSGDSRYLQKPFCYRELILAIEQLLAGER